jgi:hypothetical protein
MLTVCVPGNWRLFRKLVKNILVLRVIGMKACEMINILTYYIYVPTVQAHFFFTLSCAKKGAPTLKTISAIVGIGHFNLIWNKFCQAKLFRFRYQTDNNCIETSAENPVPL